MRPRREPVPRAKEAWVWIGGTAMLLLLGGGVAIAASLLWENIDIRQLTPGLSIPAGPLPVPANVAVSRSERRPFSAVVFNSTRNRAYFPDSAYHPGELRRWRRLIREAGGAVRDATDAEQLRQVTPDEVIVLVEAPCVSLSELAAIRSHVSRGGSVVSNWAVGVRDEECDWRGWGPLLELTGGEEVQELPRRAALYMTVPGGVPLSAGLDPGTRIELRPHPSLSLRVAGPRVYWSDWSLNPSPDEGGLGTDAAAITTHTARGGRTAWFGWRLGQAATLDDSVRVHQLVLNGILWAGGTMTASIATWPRGSRAALMFVLDVEERPGNALAAAALFREVEVPATFFVVSQLVMEDGELADALKAAGEVGSQTIDHRPLKGLTRQDQTVRLRRSADDIARWVGTPPLGLRPPEDTFDSLTIEAWRRAGGEYLVSRNEGRTASPEIHRTSRGDVVVVPRLIKDDYNVIVQDGAMRGERIADAYLAGAEKVHAIGGVAVLLGHTQIMEGARRLDAFRVALERVQAQRDWWIVTGGELARWWRVRAATQLDLDAPAAHPGLTELVATGHPDIVLRGTSDGVLRDAWVDIVLPGGPASVIPFVDGKPVDFSRTSWGIRVPAGTLAPGQERRISLLVYESGASAPSGAP